MSTTKALTSTIKRRHHLSEFRDLFTALFKIADHGVQTRVLDAINGIVNDDGGGGDSGTTCKCRKYRTFSDIGVQTTLISSVVVHPLKKRPRGKSIAVQTETAEESKQQNISIVAVVTKLEAMQPAPCPSKAKDAITIGTAPIVETNGDESVEALSPISVSTASENVEILDPDSQDSFKCPTTSRTITTKIEIEPAIVRRRKRTRKIPKVEKVGDGERSMISEIVNESMGENGTTKRFKKNCYSNEYEKFLKPKGQRTTQCEELAQLFNCYDPEVINKSINTLESSKNVLEQMKHEFEISLIKENGLYPMHRAILDNEVLQLRRQLYVLKFQKVDINKLHTDDNESPLQLAVKNNGVLPIIKELLVNNANVNEDDDNNNTIIHLAMMYSDNPELLRLLLERFDYSKLCSDNDDGNTPLHIGVNEDRFFMCKTLLEFIDDKEKIQTPGRDTNDKKILLKLYKDELNGFQMKNVSSLNRRKQKIMNATNRRNGRTALFMALSNRSEKGELMVLMLLVHMADPRVADYTGMDSASFALDTYEVNKYNNALENSVIFFERFVLNRKSIDVTRFKD